MSDHAPTEGPYPDGVAVAIVLDALFPGELFEVAEAWADGVIKARHPENGDVWLCFDAHTMRAKTDAAKVLLREARYGRRK